METKSFAALIPNPEQVATISHPHSLLPFFQVLAFWLFILVLPSDRFPTPLKILRIIHISAFLATHSADPTLLDFYIVLPMLQDI